MADQERVFNSFRIKAYRPFYSIREFRAGLVILLILMAITGWVIRRGGQPDPELFATRENQLTSKGSRIKVYEPPLQRLQESSGPALPSSPAATASNPLEPFPSGIASQDWQPAGPVQFYDETNLYIKIDGRESFYKSFGFKTLHFVSLQSAAQKDLTIDIELFDLGTGENALGAFSAENSSPDAKIKMENGSLVYLATNSGFLAQDRYYARMLGSDDRPDVRNKIKSITALMNAQFPPGKLPWTYALFVGSLGASPGAIRYQKENAFSFGFASEVYSALVPGSKETEVFIMKRDSPADATKLAGQFAEGFAGYGSALKAPAGHPEAVLVNNEFINTVEGVEPFRNFVLGIRFAKSAGEAVSWMERVKSALQKLPS